VGEWTADGGGLRHWQHRTTAVYGDGGTIGKNPSPDGGTWAWVAVDEDGWMIHWEHGWFTPPLTEEGGCETREPDHLPVVENNQSEFAAILLALRSIKSVRPDWNGLVFTDNLTTIRRWSRAGSLKNIPRDWQQEMARIQRMPGLVGDPSRWTLLDGHPSKAHILAGIGKRGYPVSVHNKQCDELCKMAAHSRSTEHVISLAP
jgi:ribonuclease HI